MGNILARLLGLLPKAETIKTAHQNVHVRWSSVLLVLGIIGYFIISSEWDKIAKLNAELSAMKTRDKVEKIEDKQKRSEAEASKSAEEVSKLDKELKKVREEQKKLKKDEKLSDKQIEEFWRNLHDSAGK